MERIDRNDLFMAMAVMYRLRGTCRRKQVGCILTHDGRIVAAGYNSSPAGLPHCTEIGCKIVEGHCVRTSHAEMAAVQSLEHRYPDLVAYITTQPCINCLRALAVAGVHTILYLEPYFTDAYRDELAKDFGIQMEQMAWQPTVIQSLMDYKPQVYSSSKVF